MPRSSSWLNMRAILRQILFLALARRRLQEFSVVVLRKAGVEAVCNWVVRRHRFRVGEGALANLLDCDCFEKFLGLGLWGDG